MRCMHIISFFQTLYHVYNTAITTMIQFKLPSPRRIFTSINALRLLWILVLFCIEHYLPRRATSLCSWPLDGPRECRLAVIADPQIVDENTYPRRGIAMWLTKVFTDRYMRRNWRYVMDQDPGLAIFVGDLMDGGREWEDNLWIPEYQRFRDVFPAVEGVRISTTIPGNHDIGLGDGIRPARLNRFISHFSSSNSTSEIIETCNFELILLDTPSLLNTQDPSIHESPLTFLENLPDPRPDVPRILFTHIPLYRTPDTSCGAYRESSRPIYYGGGYQYQNTLSEELTNRILDAMWPLAAIFTGDDHDYCLVEHTMEGRREKIPEYTVKSFSWAMGVKYPGYHLVSLGANGGDVTPVLETRLCLLPSPIDGYIVYVVMIVISLVWIIATHCKCWQREKEVQYIELDNLSKDEENLWTAGRGKRIWRWDIRGIARDILGMFCFIVICIILQIIGVY